MSDLQELKQILESARKKWPTNAELGQLRYGLETAIDRIHELEAAIQRVRDLHRGEIASTCAECPDEYGWPLPYPCPTIQAITEGDQT